MFGSNSKINRIISMVLLFAMMIGFVPMGMMKAEASGVGLPMPKRERPTKETMWSPEHDRKECSSIITFTNRIYFRH